MRRPLLLLPVLTAACTFPQFVASKVVELTLPATAVAKLACDTHNGDIEVTGDPAATSIALRAELSVRGYTQAEADANLHLLEIGRETAGGTLRLWGKYPEAELANRSPTFSFRLAVPPQLATQLESHNGDIQMLGMDGDVAIETHNGDVEGALRGHQLAVSTHNGEITLRLTGEGALDGKITSHNGDIELELAEGIGTRLDASTHNGSVKRPPGIADAVATRRSLRGRLGDGKGHLHVATHNGDVTFR